MVRNNIRRLRKANRNSKICTKQNFELQGSENSFSFKIGFSFFPNSVSRIHKKKLNNLSN